MNVSQEWFKVSKHKPNGGFKWLSSQTIQQPQINHPTPYKNLNQPFIKIPPEKTNHQLQHDRSYHRNPKQQITINETPKILQFHTIIILHLRHNQIQTQHTKTSTNHSLKYHQKKPTTNYNMIVPTTETPNNKSQLMKLPLVFTIAVGNLSTIVLTALQ